MAEQLMADRQQPVRFAGNVVNHFPFLIFAKPWMPYTYLTQTGAMKINVATSRGPYYPSLSTNYGKAALPPL
jgi:hypothetical protein